MRAAFLRLMKLGAVGFVAASLSASCSDYELPTPPAPTPLPKPSPAAQAFIDSASLPMYRDSYQMFRQDSVEVFAAEYGPPQDCPAGCVYSSAYGLRLEGKTGWMQVRGYFAGYFPDSTWFYDVASADSDLFVGALWAAMQASDKNNYWFRYVYLPLLAPDPDTDRDALLRISQMLYEDILAHLANLLLDNPRVQTDREILTLLANLPVHPPDYYQQARARAQQYLDALNGAYRGSSPNYPLQPAGSRGSRLLGSRAAGPLARG